MLCIVIPFKLQAWSLKSLFELNHSTNNSREADERRQMMLSQILSSEARERRKLKSSYKSGTVILNRDFFFI